MFNFFVIPFVTVFILVVILKYHFIPEIIFVKSRSVPPLFESMVRICGTFQRPVL